MKQAIQRLLRREEVIGERFQMLTTIFMILLFVTFWAVSFYVLINSFS